jgi:hypothetical protein
MQGPVKDYCACGCGLFGTPKKNGHIAYHCRCPSCLGRRNKTKGAAKQRKVRRAFGIEGPSLGADHEEHWRGAVRIEVKAGGQISPPWTAFLRMEAQSEASRPIGDNRPFMGIAMPDGVTDGVVLVRLSKLKDVAQAITDAGNI